MPSEFASWVAITALLFVLLGALFVRLELALHAGERRRGLALFALFILIVLGFSAGRAASEAEQLMTAPCRETEVPHA